METIRADTFAELYRYTLARAYGYPDNRQADTHELYNATLLLGNPCSNLYKNKARSVVKEYLAAELVWYMSKTLDPTFIASKAALWNKVKNPDGTVNSNYGHLIFGKDDQGPSNMSQYEWAYKQLAENKHTRQALIYFYRPRYQYFGVKDLVCTKNLIFAIRQDEDGNDRLNLTVEMRSNDLIFGLPYDLAWFTIVQQNMFLHLKSTYPNLRMGTYTHVANSLHIYDKHIDLVRNMISEVFIKDSIGVKYPFVTEDGSLKEEYQNIVNLVMKKEKTGKLAADQFAKFILDRCGVKS